MLETTSDVARTVPKRRGSSRARITGADEWTGISATPAERRWVTVARQSRLHGAVGPRDAARCHARADLLVPAPMRALILAAGMGSRLLPLTAEVPKVLVELAGKSLLERMLARLYEAGASEAVVVTGYRRDAIECWLERANLPLPVRTVHNEDYERLNNAHSVFVARDALAGTEFVKLDGDLLLPAGLLERLLACPHPSAALIDTSEAPDAEAMKASLRADGTISGFGKWLPAIGQSADSAIGHSCPEASDLRLAESIGIERIAAADSAHLFAAIERIVHREGRLDAYYEDAYHRMILEGFVMGSVDTDGAAWTEIDDARDLARARMLVETTT
ncbi:MAG: phosphocholine cytidylyltransferase family protein [Myxococcales bacterium]|nr:phosphocholine cytidylyltransferase family protein [Myxococcales bacterium]